MNAVATRSWKRQGIGFPLKLSKGVWPGIFFVVINDWLRVLLLDADRNHG
jgi:hypothetical protein